MKYEYLKPPILIEMLDCVAVTSCESVFNEKCLYDKLEVNVCYGYRPPQSLKREATKVIILTANFIQWIESRE